MHPSDEDPGFLGRRTVSGSSYIPEDTVYACWAIGWTGKVVRDPETGRMHLPGWTGELRVEVAGPEYSDAAQNRMRAGLVELASKVIDQVLGFICFEDDQPPYALVVATGCEFLETLKGTPLWDAAQDVISDAKKELNAINQAPPGDSGEDDDDEEDSVDKEPEFVNWKFVWTAASDGDGTANTVSDTQQRPTGGPDVVIGTNQATGAEVVLPYASRPGHITIVGGTGVGKTTLVERLIRQDIDNGTACIVFDVHGDMTENLLRYVSSRPERAERTLLVELDPTRTDPAFGANLYESPRPDMAERTVSGVYRFLQRFWGDDVMGPIVQSGLTHTARTIVANPGYTMAEVPYLYADKGLRAQLLQKIPESGPGQYVHLYWREYEGLARAQDRDLWRRSIVNKLEQFLANEDTYPVLAQEQSTIAWEEILTGGYCLLIRLPLSAGDRSTEYLNALLLNQLARHITARTSTPDPSRRPRVHVYLDEYRRLASEETTAFLDEARKVNVGLTVAMQTLADLADDRDREAVLQTGTRIAFRTTHEVAAAVATGFAPPPKLVAVKKGIAQSPVDYLVSHTHPNPEVRRLTQASLAPLIRELELAAGIRITSTEEESIGTRLSSSQTVYQKARESVTTNEEATQLTKARAELNKLLVDVMEGRKQPGSGDLIDRLVGVFFERFSQLSENLRVYIAGTKAAELIIPGSHEAQLVALFLPNHYTPDSMDAAARVREFVGLCLNRPKTTIRLASAKQAGLVHEAVHRKYQQIQQRRQARAVEAVSQAYVSWRRNHRILPRYDLGASLTLGVNTVGQIYDKAQSGRNYYPERYYTDHLCHFERSTFMPDRFSNSRVAEQRAAADPMGVALIDLFGEGALVMGWLWRLGTYLMNEIERAKTEQVKAWKSKWIGDPYFYEADREIKLPLVTGYPLAETITRVSKFAAARIDKRSESINQTFREYYALRNAALYGWQPIPEPSDDHFWYGDGRKQILKKIEQFVQANDIPEKYRDLTTRIFYYKAKLAARSQEYADYLLPNELIDPPPSLKSGRPIMNFMQELRVLVEQLEVEEEARSPHLAKLTEDDRQKEDDQLINMSLTLSETQHKTMLGYYRRLLTDSDNEDLLRYQHPPAFSFLTDIHRLCELLAQEPIEVSAGPQEERQQTTADVIDEVKRQLTQLSTGEAFCAFLQADQTLDTAKTKLLPAERTPAGDPEVIRQIRTVSRTRFSRSRAEIDEKTRRRRAIGTPPVQTTPPPQQATAGTPKPPSSQPRQPRPQSPPDSPPDIGEPPIGRR